MAFAVVLYFDTPTEKKILDIQQKIINTGVNPEKVNSALRPHITLGIFEQIKCADCECKINEIAFDLKLDTVVLTSLGIFIDPDKVFFLSPVPTLALVKTHEKIHEVLHLVTNGSWEIYEPGKWVPHCTVANDLEMEDLNKAISCCADLSLPIKAEISQIGVFEFEQVRPIFQIDIKR